MMEDAVKHIVVLCDNTMGIPGKEIDDGLALLYLLGLEDVCIDAILCTHGNSATENTYVATRRLVQELGVNIPVIRGADAGSEQTSDAARYIAQASQGQDGLALLSLGAATDLAAAERVAPGCLARYQAVSLMGGITHTLFVGGKVMNELNFSVDGQAACDTFTTARNGARLLLADAWNCIPLTFYSTEFIERLVEPSYAASPVLETYCLPWMEHARTAWNTDGFVGWDVLAAVALVRPEFIELEPFEVACNPRLFDIGYLEQSQDADLAAPISLITVPNAGFLCEHIYQTWQNACK